MDRRFSIHWLATVAAVALLGTVMFNLGALAGIPWAAAWIAVGALAGAWIGPLVGSLLIDTRLTWSLPVLLGIIPLTAIVPWYLGSTRAPPWAYAVLPLGLLILLRLIAPRVRPTRLVAVCERCGYDMAGLANLPCPECGHNGERAYVHRPVEERTRPPEDDEPRDAAHAAARLRRPPRNDDAPAQRTGPTRP